MDNNNKQKVHYILQTKSVYLKPYCRRYVEQYHSWFSKYPQLLHLTGSQPLTLEEQYKNHHSWIQDKTKYTFIIFSKDGQMIGDVNLFFSQWIQQNQAEINIMIARPQYKGKGIAKEVMEVLQKFSSLIYQRNIMIAKIKDDNQPSIKFFHKIGYNLIQHNTHFSEKQYRKVCSIVNKEDFFKEYKVKEEEVKNII